MVQKKNENNNLNFTCPPIFVERVPKSKLLRGPNDNLHKIKKYAQNDR